MNKRFATFLLMGKVAALPLFSQESLSSVRNIAENNSQFMDKHRLSSIESVALQDATTKERRNFIFVPDSLNKQHVPKILDLVITGLQDKDEVLIVASTEKETDKLLESGTYLLSNSKGVIILNHFSVTNSASVNKNIPADALRQNLIYSAGSARTVSIPVNLSLIPELTKGESKLNLHVIVAPNGQWNKSLVRSSEVFELRSVDKTVLISSYGDVTEDCTAYTCY
jgi:hypothetical protein